MGNKKMMKYAVKNINSWRKQPGHYMLHIWQQKDWEKIAFACKHSEYFLQTCLNSSCLWTDTFWVIYVSRVSIPFTVAGCILIQPANSIGRVVTALRAVRENAEKKKRKECYTWKWKKCPFFWKNMPVSSAMFHSLKFKLTRIWFLSWKRSKYGSPFILQPSLCFLSTKQEWRRTPHTVV